MKSVTIPKSVFEILRLYNVPVYDNFKIDGTNQFCFAISAPWLVEAERRLNRSLNRILDETEEKGIRRDLQLTLELVPDMFRNAKVVTRGYITFVYFPDVCVAKFREG